MLKHRDTGELDNRIEYFYGPKYRFIGLVNSSHGDKGEVWTGTNSEGFSIMNTASYNLKDDDLPESCMDREGTVMYKALGVCADLKDFEHFLDTLTRPMGVQANFGVIDAKGGCAYYEVNNHKWVKIVVNDYKVVTNFSFSGVEGKGSGYERYATGCEIMKDIPRNSEGKFNVDHSDIFNAFSRSYRHSLLGIKDLRSVSVAVDQDFIPRRITSASTVIEGVRKGEDPLHTVMWSILGYPACSVAVPLVVGPEDMIPDYMKMSGSSNNSALCDVAMKIKTDNVFIYKRGNGKAYFNSENVYKLIDVGERVENKINISFADIFTPWVAGVYTDEEFYSEYREKSALYYGMYLSGFASFIKND